MCHQWVWVSHPAGGQMKKEEELKVWREAGRQDDGLSPDCSSARFPAPMLGASGLGKRPILGPPTPTILSKSINQSAQSPEHAVPNRQEGSHGACAPTCRERVLTHMIEMSSRRMRFASFLSGNGGTSCLITTGNPKKAANVCAASPRRTGALGVLAEPILLGKLLRAACK